MAHVGPASPDLRRGKATVPRTFLLRGLAKCETAPFSLFSRHGCLQNGIRFSDWWSSSYNYGVQITCYRQEVHRILYVAGVRFRLPNHVYLGSSGNKECTDTRVWIFHEWQRNQAEKLSIRLSNTKERMNDRKVERKETNKNRPLENWTILLFTTVVCVLWIFLFVSGSFGAYVDQANCIAPVFPTVHNIISMVACLFCRFRGKSVPADMAVGNLRSCNMSFYFLSSSDMPIIDFWIRHCAPARVLVYLLYMVFMGKGKFCHYCFESY